jgi:hypothetical protein
VSNVPGPRDGGPGRSRSELRFSVAYNPATKMSPWKESLVEPELLIAAGQVRQVLLNIGSQFGH